MATTVITNNGLIGSQTMRQEVNGGYPQAQRKKAQVKAAPAPSAKHRSSPAPSAKQAASQPTAQQPLASPKLTGPVATTLTAAAQPFAPGSLTMQASLIQNGETSYPSWLNSQAGPPGTFSGQQATSSAARGRFSNKFMPHQLCNHYNTQGYCRKAEQCTFAHGLHELHPEVAAMYGQQPNYSTSASALAMLEAKGAAFLHAQAMAQSSPDFYENGHPQQETLENGLDITSKPPLNATSSVRSSIVGTTSLGPSLNSIVGTTSLGPSLTEVFKFNPSSQEFKPFVVSSTNALKFNADAAPFIPKAFKAEQSTNEEPKANVENSQANGAISLTLPIERRSGGSGEPSPTSLRDRVAPLPLSLGEEKTPSGRRTSFAPLDTPTARGSPTASLTSQLIGGTPTARTPVNARILSSQALSPRGTPKAVSPSATVFGRDMLLKARSTAKKLEQGPPGLGMCAPTPTSAARNFGFQYPQPGFVSARKFSLSTSLPPPSGERTTERKYRVKANAPWKKADFMSG